MYKKILLCITLLMGLHAPQAQCMLRRTLFYAKTLAPKVGALCAMQGNRFYGDKKFDKSQQPTFEEMGELFKQMASGEVSISTPMRDEMKRCYVALKKAIEEQSPTQMFLKAAIEGRIDAIQSALDAGADVNATDNSGRSALHWACKNKAHKIVELLCKHKANTNLADKAGRTPLHLLCEDSSDYDHIILKLLLENGANLGAEDKDRLTPLHLALCLVARNKSEIKSLKSQLGSKTFDAMFQSMESGHNSKAKKAEYELPRYSHQDAYDAYQAAYDDGVCHERYHRGRNDPLTSHER